MCGFPLFLVLFTIGLFSICLEWPKEKIYISKSIIYTRKKKFNNIKKCNLLGQCDIIVNEASPLSTKTSMWILNSKKQKNKIKIVNNMHIHLPLKEY